MRPEPQGDFRPCGASFFRHCFCLRGQRRYRSGWPPPAVRAAPLMLSSSAIQDGRRGAGQILRRQPEPGNAPLSWTNVPAAAQSLVLIVHDADVVMQRAWATIRTGSSSTFRRPRPRWLKLCRTRRRCRTARCNSVARTARAWSVWASCPSRRRRALPITMISTLCPGHQACAGHQCHPRRMSRARWPGMWLARP